MIVEHPNRNVISIKQQSMFIEITLRHGCSPLNLLYTLRTPFPKNTSGQLLLYRFLGIVGAVRFHFLIQKFNSVLSLIIRVLTGHLL